MRGRTADASSAACCRGMCKGDRGVDAGEQGGWPGERVLLGERTTGAGAAAPERGVWTEERWGNVKRRGEQGLPGGVTAWTLAATSLLTLVDCLGEGLGEPTESTPRWRGYWAHVDLAITTGLALPGPGGAVDLGLKTLNLNLSSGALVVPPLESDSCTLFLLNLAGVALAVPPLRSDSCIGHNILDDFNSTLSVLQEI